MYSVAFPSSLSNIYVFPTLHIPRPQGFSTTKGELVRSILFPPPLDFKFHSDFVKSIYVFLTLGLIGMAYSVYMWTKRGVSE